jgi:hypothetical protein
MNILVIGNCQARPLSSLLCDGKANVALEPIILHLTKEADQDTHETLLQKADLVVSQATSQSFLPNHLSSDYIKERFRDRSIIWPNIFYAGQTPYLRYVTHRTMGRLIGPLDVYHDLRILRDWYEKRLGIALPQSDIRPAEVVDRSIEDLRAKEVACDVIISDLIEAEQTKRRLFFTFNHPTHWLLARLAERVSDIAEIALPSMSSMHQEFLGRIVPPSIFADLGDEGVEFIGIDRTPSGNVIRRNFNRSEINSASLNSLDSQRELLADLVQLRFTPNY